MVYVYIPSEFTVPLRKGIFADLLLCLCTLIEI